MKKLTMALVCVGLATPASAHDMGAFWSGWLLGNAIRNTIAPPQCYWQDVPVYDDWGRVVAWRRVCL